MTSSSWALLRSSWPPIITATRSSARLWLLVHPTSGSTLTKRMEMRTIARPLGPRQMTSPSNSQPPRFCRTVCRHLVLHPRTLVTPESAPAEIRVGAVTSIRSNGLGEWTSSDLLTSDLGSMELEYLIDAMRCSDAIRAYGSRRELCNISAPGQPFVSLFYMRNQWTFGHVCIYEAMKTSIYPSRDRVHVLDSSHFFSPSFRFLNSSLLFLASN